MVLSSVATISSAQVMVNGSTPYTDLASAFAAINAGTHTGAITIDISASTVEPGVARLNRGDASPANFTSVDIHVTAANVVVEGSATAVIELRGADAVTIDGHWAGSANPNSRDLTIRNTSTGYNNVCVWITSSTSGGANGANNNLITNCKIEGVSYEETSYGIVTGGSGVTVGATAGFPNNNNRIINNTITKVNTGIAIAGNTGADLNGRITGNTIGTLNFSDAVGPHGISVANVNGMHISNNVILGLTTNVSTLMTGIDLGGNAIVNTEINNNRIHDLENPDETNGFGVAGIYFAPAIVGNNNKIWNNEIHSLHSYGRDISLPFTGDNGVYGIALLTGEGYNVFHNTVYMNIAHTDFVGGGTSAALYIGAGVDLGGTAPVTLMNNILSNTITGPGDQYSVYSEIGAVFDTIDYNLYNAPAALSYMGAVATTLADWKTLSLQDNGSVSGNIAFTLIADAILVDITSSSSWLANGRAMRLGSFYQADINSTNRSILNGHPNDMGSAEFTPSVAPPIAVASGAPVAGGITTYSVGNRKVAEIEWDNTGTVPTTVDLQYYSGVDAPLYLVTDDKINSYYAIAQTGGTGFGARVKFYYTYAENDDLPDALLQVVKDTTGAGAWSNFGGAAAQDPDGSRYVGFNSNFMETFGNFTLGNHPVSLEFMAFSGKNIGEANQLNWSTASEDHMDNFDVLRSEDGINFRMIGNVKARNEAISNEYIFRDDKPVTGFNYYKLRINALNGGYQYSKVVAVKYGSTTNIDITSLYPNPAMNTITVGLNSLAEDMVNIQVTDIAGKTMISQKNSVVAGSNEVKLDVSGLAAGIYMIKAILADGTVSVQKFVKQ
jgi:hypothetical protein